MNREEADKRFVDVIRECNADEQALEDRRRRLTALGADLVALGNWLMHVPSGTLGKETFSHKLNVTEDVSLTRTLTYLPADDLVDLVNSTHTLAQRVQDLKKERTLLNERILRK